MFEVVPYILNNRSLESFLTKSSPFQIKIPICLTQELRLVIKLKL